MGIFSTKPALRWIAPVAVVGLVGASGLVASTASADPLPERSAKQLLVDVQQARLNALSGTVVQRADLGIPEIPGAGGSGGSELNSLVAGTHTLKVWYAGPDKARLQLLGRLGESDVIRNGSDLWIWSSEDNAATHRTIPEREADRRPLPTDAPKTPQEAADRALAAVDPSTEVSTSRNVTVASRAAYELVLRPKDKASLLTEVRIAIDGVKHIPLRVQAFAGERDVFEVGYTAVDFARPDDAQFAFNPPPGATVTKVPATVPDKVRKHQRTSRPAGAEPTVVGTGWTSVLLSKAPASTDRSGQFGAFLRSLPRVSGDWGSGRQLAGTAFSVVVTDDGRVAAGAVRPERLYEALRR